MSKNKSLQEYLYTFLQIEGKRHSYHYESGSKIYDFNKNLVKEGKSINDCYHSIFVKKKSGGRRVIAIPNPELKQIQKELSSIFERAIILHDSKSKSFILSDNQRYLFESGKNSYGFEKNKNIKMNADVHKNGKYFFKTDIEKFFDSFDLGMIKKTTSYALKLNIESIEKRIKKEFKGYNLEILYDAKNTLNKLQKKEKNMYNLNMIVALLSYNGKLATGSPASPALANLYMRPFDNKVNVWLKNLEVKTGQKFNYTRYADDICISSDKKIPDKVSTYIDKTLKKFKLKMNAEKTVFQTNKAKNVITGINVTPEGYLTVGKNKKIEFKQMLYETIVLEKNGNINKLLGNANYIRYVEEDWYFKMIIKYFKMKHKVNKELTNKDLRKLENLSGKNYKKCITAIINI